MIRLRVRWLFGRRWRHPGGGTVTTNVAIDDELLARALEMGGERTEKATVEKALHEFVGRRERRTLLDLFGTLDWDEDFDYKRQRTRS